VKIGIDIDGVLTNLENWKINYGSKFLFEKYRNKIANPEKTKILEIFDLDKNIDNEFWDEYYREYASNADAMMFCSEVIKKLKSDGNEIYIITARGTRCSDSKELAIEWLNKNEIYYDKIFFNCVDKLKVCTENNIDIMIEDYEENINQISTVIPVICVNATSNLKCIGNRIYRCYTWYDIYAKINFISQYKS
jgi:uncharacterized HAD superfamily protein